jgi:hypothetical protein
MSKGEWTFLTNHGRVLIYVAKHPLTTAREMAQMAGITERTVQKIVADLVRGGYLVAHRRGRCNQYVVHPERPMRGGYDESPRLRTEKRGRRAWAPERNRLEKVGARRFELPTSASRTLRADQTALRPVTLTLTL